MRVLLVVAALAQFAAIYAAAQSDQAGLNPYSRAYLEAYAEASDLPPLAPTDSDQIRVWETDLMSGAVVGHVIVSGHVTTYALTAGYDGDVFAARLIRRRETSIRSLGQRTLSHMTDWVSLDGLNLGCGVIDGTDVLVEGVANGRRFAFDASNPQECDDANSRVVTTLLDLTARMPR